MGNVVVSRRVWIPEAYDTPDIEILLNPVEQDINLGIDRWFNYNDYAPKSSNPPQSSDSIDLREPLHYWLKKLSKVELDVYMSYVIEETGVAGIAVFFSDTTYKPSISVGIDPQGRWLFVFEQDYYVIAPAELSAEGLFRFILTIPQTESEKWAMEVIKDGISLGKVEALESLVSEYKLYFAIRYSWFNTPTILDKKVFEVWSAKVKLYF